MVLQHRLSFLPNNAEIVSEHLAVVRDDERITFFNASGPIHTCSTDDEMALRFAAVVLSDRGLGLATSSQVARAIDRHRSRVYDYHQRHREGGAKALEPKRRGPRGPSKLKGTVLARAQRHLNQDKPNTEVAKLVGVSELTIRKGLKDGRLIRPKKKTAERSSHASEEAPSTPRKRSEEDASCSGGVATRRKEERALAATGLLMEARPQFEFAESVARAGVLVALPALLGQGLLDVGEAVYGSLKNGYYGLSSMLLTFAMMALLRIKSIEGLTGHAPGEFGLVLGLDRAPEMKTARRKLAELAGHEKAFSFSRAFTERWAEEDPGVLGYLYIDGHVRPYHGRKHKLPETLVQRRRLCMPATTDYWVNDANAEPLMFVTAPANDGLLEMMGKKILPEIRKLVGGDRRVTLIFDREGWSPKTFKRWEQDGFDVLTYRKGRYTDWDQCDFREVPVEVCGQKVSYLLAERMVTLSNDFSMREVRRLCDDGHQVPVVTTRHDLALESVALRMFSRWQQENFFRYMRHEFALDHLPTTAVEQADPERAVASPARKEKKRELNRVKAELAKAERAYGQKANDNRDDNHRTDWRVIIALADLEAEIKRRRSDCGRLETEIRALPACVPVRGTMDGHPVVRLEQERKIITDVIKMVAYRAETQLANLVAPLLASRSDEARKFIRQVFELPADLIPNLMNRTLSVRLHSMSTPRENSALATLCNVLNELEVCFPGTELRLVLEPTEAG